MAETQYDFPTEVLDLPSKGLVYPKENPLSSGRVTIKYMTAKEEDILSNQNLIKKGIVLDKLFESIILDKIDIKDITIGDKNAIILATRLLGYGPDYNFKFYSSKTGDVIETQVDLSKIQTKEIDFSLFKNKNEFEFTTPQGKNKLTFKLLTHGDELLIDKDIQALEKMSKDGSFEITTRLRYMIKSIDGNRDQMAIYQFIQSLPIKDSQDFKKYVRENKPGLDLTQTATTPSGDKIQVEIGFGVEFFRPFYGL
jgi:hypothetical protein